MSVVHVYVYVYMCVCTHTATPKTVLNHFEEGE